MNITSVKTILCSAPHRDAHMPSRTMRSAAFILISTDSGHTGIGETYAGYFVPEQVPAAVEFYAPILVGQSPLDTDALYRRMFVCGKFWARVGFGSIVLSGIEMALLDLKGKVLGVPAYELLGGRCHESIPSYATGGPSSWPEDKLEAKVACYLGLGFNRVKLGAGRHIDGCGAILPGRTAGEAADLEVAKVEFLGRKFGKNFPILMDGHMDNLGEEDRVWDEGMAAAVLQALENYPVDFFEEPLPYTNKKSYRSLRGRTRITVAGGECLTSLEEWRDWLDEEPFGLAQLDASFMGGLANFTKIARLCEVRDIPIATHAWSATVGVAGNLHAAFACRNTRFVEMAAYCPDDPSRNSHLHSPLMTELWIVPPSLENGRLRLADTPGLGVHLPEGFAERYPFVPGTGEFNAVTGKLPEN